MLFELLLCISEHCSLLLTFPQQLLYCNKCLLFTRLANVKATESDLKYYDVFNYVVVFCLDFKAT